MPSAAHCDQQGMVSGWPFIAVSGVFAGIFVVVRGVLAFLDRWPQAVGRILKAVAGAPPRWLGR